MEPIFDLSITATGTARELVKTLKQLTERLDDCGIAPEDLEIADLHFPVSVEAHLSMWEQPDLLDVDDSDSH
jgi:hypothetical protein